jgi:hypothetical protein
MATIKPKAMARKTGLGVLRRSSETFTGSFRRSVDA